MLTSVVLAVSVLRLARRRALVQDLYSIETLARVDVLCLDKTGTITEGSMQLDELVRWTVQIRRAARRNCRMTVANGDANPTFTALREGCGDPADWEAEQVVPFSSARKWSGVSFHGHGSYILGAGEFILRDRFSEIRETSKLMHRKEAVCCCLPFLSCLRRPKHSRTRQSRWLSSCSATKSRERPETLRYFSEQGVTLKVISGDDAATAASIAGKAACQARIAFLTLPPCPRAAAGGGGGLHRVWPRHSGSENASWSRHCRIADILLP